MSNGTQQITPVTPQTLLDAHPRCHLAVPLKVAEGFGERFQPTGFPNLGAALYKAVVGRESVDHLLVETAQSLANWMEHVCLDPQKPCRYNTNCTGIPYVVVRENDADLTSSLTEPHRLASDELLEKSALDGTRFDAVLAQLFGVNKQRPLHLPRIAKRLFYLDPACLLHGVFLEKLDGRIRFPRLLSATITAKHPEPVSAGGVMRGYVTIEGKEASIPYSAQHFTSPAITLNLIFHTDSLDDLGLDREEQALLAALAAYKINRLLASFPRLRTACVFDVPGQQANQKKSPTPDTSGAQTTADDKTAPYSQSLTGAIKDAFTSERRRSAFSLSAAEKAPTKAEVEAAKKASKEAKEAHDKAEKEAKKAAKTPGAKEKSGRSEISEKRDTRNSMKSATAALAQILSRGIILGDDQTAPCTLTYDSALKSSETDRRAENGKTDDAKEG